MKKFFALLAASLVCQLSNAQLTIYSAFDQQGVSGTCLARTIYADNSIPGGLNDGIKSISLDQGYMATLSENADGTGEGFNYIASVSDLTANLALVLQNKVSFIRVLPIQANLKKKGAGSNDPTNITADSLKAGWLYDWGPNDVSTPTREYAPMAWGRSGASTANVDNVIAKTDVTCYLAFNEPDNTGQSNIPFADAVPLYANLLRSGHRMGSPAPTEEEYRVWLQSFVTSAEQQNLRIDFIAIHWYDWGNWTSANPDNDPTAIFNRFKAYITNVYNRYNRPIWITEFNANRNRPSAIHEAFMALALPWLETDPRVERYAYFFPPGVPAMSGGLLTPAGRVYSEHVSSNAYPANVIDTRAVFPKIVSWNTSGQTQGGASVSNFAPTYLDANLTAPAGLTRGSGTGVPGSGGPNGYWGATSFSNTAAAGVTANKFLTFRLQSTNGKIVTYTSIDTFKIFLGVTSPLKYQIDYQLNSGTFQPCATVTGPTRLTVNASYSLGPIDLSSIAGLQNVPPTTTVTFRITPFEVTGTGGLFFGAGTTDTRADLSIAGFFTDATLPIDLSDFRSNKIEDKVLLTWKTQSEVDFSHFVLERSTNGTAFYDIAKIDGSKRPAGSTYNHTDTPDATTTNYYRLKMVDVDGSFVHSRILSESFEASDALLAVHPSVSTGNNLNAFFKEVSASAQLKVFSSTGQLLIMYNLSAGTTTQAIDVADLAEGVYFLILQDRDSIQSTRFVKQ